MTASDDEHEEVEYRDGRGDTHRCHEKGLDLQKGQQVLINDRSRPLTVTGFHARQNTSRTRRRRGVGKYYRVVELEGNGTEYHLLCLDGAEHGPMLYKESEWDDDRTNKIGERPKYARMGDRVRSLEVVD